MFTFQFLCLSISILALHSCNKVSVKLPDSTNLEVGIQTQYCEQTN